MNIYNFTKNSSDSTIVMYEIKYRWKKIIKPGLNKENKQNFIYLINLLLNCKFIRIKDKIKLNNYIEELK